MEKKHKRYLKINLMSLVFIVVSFISVTLAWFAYSGISNVQTEIGVKAWYIELEKDGETVSNDVVITLDDIYPGMPTVNEIVKVKNLGDSDAQVNYSIETARILGDAADNYIASETITSDYIEDRVSHAYPFHINVSLSKNYILATTGEAYFEVSISWPLDSGDDEFDTLWGTAAYEFQQNEALLKSNDPEYQTQPSIQVVISLIAEQYIATDDSSDPRYNLGDVILYDIQNDGVCSEVSSTCLKTYVIDANNKLSDDNVTLLPDPTLAYSSGVYADYASLLTTQTSTWTATSRALTIEDLMPVISKDITNTLLVRSGLSDSVLGSLKYQNRTSTEISRLTNSSGYYKISNENYSFMTSDVCYWINTEYNTNNGFALKNIDETNSKIYGETKTNTCKVIPVLVVSKMNL